MSGAFSKFSDPYPSGAIIVWRGSASDIPEGWLLCDGNNGTPNLLDRYPKGIATASTDPGSTGGNNTYSLSKGQLPSHSHGGSVGTSGNHNHGLGAGTNSNKENSYPYEDQSNSNATKFKSLNSTDWSHTHNFYSQYDGSGNSIDNKPNSTELFFIQKS